MTTIGSLIAIWCCMVAVSLWVQMRSKAIGSELSETITSDIEALQQTWRTHVEHMVQREKTIAGILEGVDGWWDWYVQDGVEVYSDKFRQILGYESEEDFPNTPESWQQAIEPDDVEHAYRAFEAHCNSKGKVPYKVLVRYRTKQGRMVVIFCRGTVIEWDGEKPIRMVGTHTDVTGMVGLDPTLPQGVGAFH